MDRRLTPANARVAGAELRGVVEAERFVGGETQTIGVPVVDLCADPGGKRDCQLLYGAPFRVLERQGGHAFGQSLGDGYVGYLDETALRPPVEATHFVCTPSTHAYPQPEVKTKELMHLPFGSRVRVVSASGAFFETEEGYFIPKPHLRPLNAPYRDPVPVAQLFFGVPYLWGGNSALGIDCSGLVQTALMACGRDCPRDGDMQEAALGKALPEGTPYARGDLLFWKGHVAIVMDGETMLHANAHHMAVAYEPIEEAIARIAAAGDGPVTGHKRL